MNTATAPAVDHGVWAGAMANAIEPLPTYKETWNPDRELNRWLFYPGNVIEPKRARELRFLRAGGMEVDSVCLRRFKGCVPRLVLTPLEMTPEWMPPERIPEGVPAVAAPVIPFPQTMDEQTFNLINMAKGRTPGVKVFPGDALTAILATANNDTNGRQGLVEITALKGHLYDSDMWRTAQEMFFGGAPYFANDRAQEPVFPADWPRTLSAVRARLEAVKSGTSESAFLVMADEMLAACDDFYWWGAKIVSDGVAFGKQPPKDGFTFVVPPLVRLLSEQLEIPLEEDNMRLIQQSLNASGRVSPAPVAVVDNTSQQLIQMLMEEREALKAERAADRAEIAAMQARLDAAFSQQPAPAETVPVKPKK